MITIFFSFYNMKKIKWRYFFYSIYIWFNNKLLVVWLIYLGYLKKDIDIPFSFFFFFLFCGTCFDVGLLSTIIPFRAILLNIILTHDPLGLRVAQTYLNQYLHFLIGHWIHVIRNQHYVEMVKTNIAAICLIFLIIWYKLMVYIFKTILDELFVATSIRATSRVTLYGRRLSNKIY